ncbi:replication protein [Calothrix sp. HK-06]|nr:replication protein [Calothrix sp. HK-06]
MDSFQLPIIKKRLKLSDASVAGKIWDKHRANAQKIAEHYADAKEEGFARYAWRVKNCSKWLEFDLLNGEEDTLQLKLKDTRFCRVRHCPVCQWRRSLMWKAKTCKILPQIINDYPKHRWLFMTLTVKNCHIEELRLTLNQINKSFKRLTELKMWRFKGWVKSVEVTKGRDGVSAHPHLHILAMAPPSYFSHGYISQAKWVDIWQQCLKVNYQPVVHVSAIAKHQDPEIIIPEILKYQVKESDLVADAEWFLELTRQLHKTRGISAGGVLKEYMRNLEEKSEDLVNENKQTQADEEASLCFTWQATLGKYIK